MVTDASADALICTPDRYSQVQDGEEYERVDCRVVRETNRQCSARTYNVSELQVSTVEYSSTGDLPQQGKFKGRFELSIFDSDHILDIARVAKMIV